MPSIGFSVILFGGMVESRRIMYTKILRKNDLIQIMPFFQPTPQLWVTRFIQRPIDFTFVLKWIYQIVFKQFM